MEDTGMEYLTSFKKMITPLIIQVLYWIGIAGVVIAAFSFMFRRGGFWIGLVYLVLGPIMVRVYAELLIVLFRMHDALYEISDTLKEIKASK
jgi:hypothetical protein